MFTTKTKKPKVSFREARRRRIELDKKIAKQSKSWKAIRGTKPSRKKTKNRPCAANRKFRDGAGYWAC